MIRQLAKALLKLWGLIKREFLDSASLIERGAKPSHYLLRIDDFSKISTNVFQKEISNLFEAGGYKWNLMVHLNVYGDDDDSADHISLSLEMANNSALPNGWQIDAVFNFFVYDQLKGKYLGLRELMQGRFHSLCTRITIENFIDIDTFKNPSNGYLLNDACVFGVEVFVVEEKASREEILNLLDEPKPPCKYTWKMENFSQKKGDDEWHYSDYFIHCDYKWRIMLNPRGASHGKGTHISVGLEVDSSTLPPDTKLLVNVKLRLRDQTKREEHNEFERSESFLSSSFDYCDDKEIPFSVRVWNFISHTKFQDPNRGYLVNDICILEAEVDVVAVTSLLSKSGSFFIKSD